MLGRSPSKVSHEHRVSYETIYNCIYAQPVGELKRELIATLRHPHNKRVPRRPTNGLARRPKVFANFQGDHVVHTIVA
jgi:hypothetical protein